LPATNIHLYRWGYLAPGSTIPASIPPLISRLITPALLDTPCRYSFNVSALSADVASINQYGAFNISYPRLAFIDGEADPWRWAGTHRPGLKKKRVDSVKEPWVLIEGAVHHWDENGLEGNGTIPEAVLQTQLYEVEFVKAWVDGEFCAFVGGIVLTVLQTITRDVGTGGSANSCR
jgi:hypothetical protein